MKNNLQQLILRFISRKKAAKTDDIVSELEEQLDSADYKTKPRYQITRTLKHLQKSGLVDVHETAQSKFARLSPAGRHRLRSIDLSSDSTMIPTTWDGQWRFVILDLPESRKSERDSLRYILKKANFILLKNSVWVSPYPLEHLLSNMKTDLGLGDELIIIVSSYLDQDIEGQLLENFGFIEKLAN